MRSDDMDLKANHASGRTASCARVAAGLILLFSAPIGAQTFFPVDGFEESVKPVISADREIMVVPTESEDGTSSTLQVFNLDPTTGNVIGQPTILAAVDGVLGWENGVNPIIVNTGGTHVVVAPTETEDGSAAAVIVLQVNNNGAITDRAYIGLGDLGFQDDVDPVGVTYNGTGAFVPLETENNAVSGILAIKIDAGLNVFGRCTALTSDGRVLPACDNFPPPPGLLTGFKDGVDGIGYTIVDGARYAVPLAPPGPGFTGDLGFFDFDFGIPGPPVYLRAFSVKALNSAGQRPVTFPGFERDVDMTLLDNPILDCKANGATCRLLVPVEDQGGNSGDLYLINGVTGQVFWAYNFDNPATAPRILGYEEAVDAVPWMNLNPPLVAVPTENQQRTQADLILVDLTNGHFQAAIDGANGAFRVIGYQKGVEPLLWSPNVMVVPMDDQRGSAYLVAINASATILSAAPSGSILGFERSVDPRTLPLNDPDRTLYVPVEKKDQTDAGLLIFPGPPPSFAGMISFETQNPGTTILGYERDVDATLHQRGDGLQYLYVPEESPGGLNARLRIQPIPFPPGGTGDTVLALPTELEVAAIPGNLYFVMPNGIKLGEHPDVFGYELGVGPTSALGDAKAPSPPSPNPLPGGYASDEDNTLTMENSYYGDLDGDGRPDALDCAPREGGVWAAPGAITGLMPDYLISVGLTQLAWDSQAVTAGPDTRYDVVTGLASELKADGDFHRAFCLADDLSDTPYFDFRAPPLQDAFYWLVRAENVCGTATWGRPELDTASPCP
jgi:hypothetical protein